MIPVRIGVRITVFLVWWTCTGVAIKGILRLFTETHFIKMIGTYPLPNDVTLPGYLNDCVVYQAFVRYLRIFHDFMTEDDCPFPVALGRSYYDGWPGASNACLPLVCLYNILSAGFSTNDKPYLNRSYDNARNESGVGS